MRPLICKVEYNSNNKQIRFDSVENPGLTLTQIIENDKRYGTMKPANGKYFTFIVLNEDQEFSKKQSYRAMRYAQKRWRIYGDIPRFRIAKVNEVIDFRLEFRTTETDPDKNLTDNTVMYHYYPINDVNNRFRGLCVVNKKFFYTSHGDKVKGHFLESKGIEVQYPNGDYGTLDFDEVYGHELGHGLGLPHDPEEENMMAYRVDLMVEFPSERDQTRIIAKYGKAKLSTRFVERWLAWLIVASDR